MTVKQRVIVIGIVCTLLLSGFAFGRLTDSPSRISAEGEKTAAATAVNSSAPTQASGFSSDQAVRGPGTPFYLQDFKSGYADGFNSARTGESPTPVAANVIGYDEGFKQGYADSYKSRLSSNTANAPVAYRSGQQVEYRSSAPAARRKGNSKLKTVLTIAAPAAIGAGIGAAAGGGKGAGIGALIGGGGGAMYHLIKNRNR
jgi:hypothetical protein